MRSLTRHDICQATGASSNQVGHAIRTGVLPRPGYPLWAIPAMREYLATAKRGRPRKNPAPTTTTEST